MKIVPPVGLIEAALDHVSHSSHDPHVGIMQDRALKEFRALGAGRLKVAENIPGATTDLERGYLLGLETARKLLEGMPAAMLAGVAI